MRDRDDRLRRLFLEPGADIGAQLQAIQDDSARYNLGIVERNINVPLFLLRFLQPENRPRFSFRLAGTRRAAGVETWRVEFEERVFPTIITDKQGNDVDAKGWFLVDQLTGAIVETALKIEEHESTGEIGVVPARPVTGNVGARRDEGNLPDDDATVAFWRAAPRAAHRRKGGLSITTGVSR